MMIGVVVESLGMGLREGIRKARELGVEGVQIYARGDIDPDNLSLSGRRDLIYYLESHGLILSALCGDLGGHGFEREEENLWKVEKTKRIMDLAMSLRTKVVTTHIGVIPEEKSHPRRRVMEEALRELGEYGEKREVYLAIETGPESPEVLRGFICALGTEGVKVNYDPANLVMVAGSDPVKGVYTLKEFIVHTHAKDGVKLSSLDPKTIYAYFAEGGVGDLCLEEHFREVPLGEGEVNFPLYVAALEEVNYGGFLTIERESGEDRVSDIARGIDFLRSLMRQGGL